MIDKCEQHFGFLGRMHDFGRSHRKFQRKKNTNHIILRSYWFWGILVALVFLLGWYYHLKTYYSIEPIFSNISYSGNHLGIYYLDMPHTWRPATQLVDAKGFAVINVDNKLVRQPVSHCQLIFDVFHKYTLSHSRKDAHDVIRLADMLVDEMKEIRLNNHDGKVLWYNFPWIGYKKPWISAMAQGQAMSALCRAYQVEPKSEYLDAAEACMAVFEVDLQYGGVRSYDEYGNIYYEEYAIPGRAFKVLNGFIYCLLGLYDFYRVTGNAKAMELFNAGIRTLSEPGVLSQYDLGFWTTYDLSPYRHPSFNYSAVHVRQLTILYNITGKQIFQNTAVKWRKYNLEHKYRILYFVWSSWKRIIIKYNNYKNQSGSFVGKRGAELPPLVGQT